MLTQIMNPYLCGTDAKSEAYQNGMFKCIEILSEKINKSQCENLKVNKLQLYKSKINEAQYIQSACELVVCSYFAEKYSDDFLYEPQLNPPKDVDCAFFFNNLKFNIEVKCADYSTEQSNQKREGIHLSFLGRHPQKDDVVRDFEEMFNTLPSDKKLNVSQHMDNKMKDFLLSAQEKFNSNSNESELNILVICCDTPADIQKWFGYLYDNEGLFTKNSFYEQSGYNLIDVVYITNLYHRHYSYTQKDKINNHWSLEDSFNLVCSNPFRCCDKKLLIETFAELSPNFSYEIDKYQPSGKVEQFVKDHIRISCYVNEVLIPQERYLFQPNNQIK